MNNGQPKLSPAEQLKRWRAKRKLSQRDAAEKLGIKRGTLQSWERKSNPRTPNPWLWATIKPKLK